ncbi:RNA12 protein-domain-containing protein [Morchella snyderi]|nr:RNA12 protein-domain-containing protein [Morchella snyderi]
MYRRLTPHLRHQYLRQSVVAARTRCSPILSRALHTEWPGSGGQCGALNTKGVRVGVGSSSSSSSGNSGGTASRTPFGGRSPARTWGARETSTAAAAAAAEGYNETGYVNLAPGEGLLFFDNIFPLKTAVFDIRYLITRLDKVSFQSRIRNTYIPPSLTAADSPHNFAITAIIPRIKDGGAFVKYTSTSPAAAIEAAVSQHLSDQAIKPWYSPLARIRAYAVQGRPWLEDLRIFPTTRLKVEFTGGGDAALSQEQLYTLFRRYGKIVDIHPQPPASKDLPHYAMVQYATVRSATAARNCLHGLVVAEGAQTATGKQMGVTLRILYERTLKAHWIRDWLFSHPRIVIPIVAALLAAVTVAVFDPVRTWFIEAKITRALNFTESAYWVTMKKYTVGQLPLGRKHETINDLWAVWDERVESVNQLQAWLRETVETFIVVQGPRGSGKKDLVVDTVLKGRNNVLVIDCEPIDEAHGDSATIAAAAAQVGYRPVFSWLNTISSLLDLAAQGTLGGSAGFSQTLETQFTKILQNTGTALKRIALKDKGNSEKDTGLSDDEYLSTHPEKRPVVVIDNFLHMEGNSIIYERLADWAALLVSANVAHVIFLTNDTTFSKSLSKSLPDRVFRSILLGDAAPESAKRFVLKHINDELTGPGNEKALAELDSSIQALGGRLTDLESLARRIKTGESPRTAVQEIIETSAAEILKLYFLEEAAGYRKKRTWAPEHAWFLVRALAAAAETDGQVPFNRVVFDDVFRGEEEPVQNLEQAEMVQIVVAGGRPWAVRPGRPVYLAAFRRLLEDGVLAAKMDLLCLKAVVRGEEAVIEKAEREMAVLATLQKLPKGRMECLLERVAVAQAKVAEAEKKMAALKKTLKTDY